jgi:restriction system protein
LPIAISKWSFPVPTERKLGDVIKAHLKGDIARIEVFDMESESDGLGRWRAYTDVVGTETVARVYFSDNLTADMKDLIIERELGYGKQSPPGAFIPRAVSKVMDHLTGSELGSRLELSVSGIIAPIRQTGEGVLVKCLSLVWSTIMDQLTGQWHLAYEIPPHKWEEIIAAAYSKAGYDEVTLTPRSGDHGRDVIAVRKGVGSVRILGSVKAYSPGHLITKEQVHALLGVVSADPNASRIITTTSDFAPRMLDDKNLAAAIPHRIERMIGTKLQEWLKDLTKRSDNG